MAFCYVLTVVYEQITLLWRHFILEITLGNKIESKSIPAISNRKTYFRAWLKLNGKNIRPYSHLLPL